MKNALTETSRCAFSQAVTQMANATCRAKTNELVVGCGLDAVEMKVFGRSVELGGQIFLNRIYTELELNQAQTNISTLAQTFAAKEAVSKALGTGMRGVNWLEIEILFDTSKAKSSPHLALTGNAQKATFEKGIDFWELQVTQTSDFALAFVVAWRRTVGNLSN